MMAPLRPASRLSFLFVILVFSSRCEAQKSVVKTESLDDGWRQQRDEQTGAYLKTKELTLYPRGEPKPALKYRLVPDPFQAVEGNAAIFYLKASGFLGQDPARERIMQIRREARARAQKEGEFFDQTGPDAWLSTPPDQLPVEEVKKYLALTAFQPPLLREAASRTRFDMSRNLRDIDNLAAYLLPEIQNLRELFRTQSLRCRLAIAEGRIDDAIEITGQQFALARHLGQDDFLISNLVGISAVSVAWNDALYLVQQADTPNLYWALASMPSPLVDMRRAMAVERQFLYLQMKALREVNETPRPAGYWQDFVTRLVPQIGFFSLDLHLPSPDQDPQSVRAAVVGYIVAAYPGAKEYLINEQQLPREMVEAYPTAQVVFLAMVRFFDQWRDEQFKWMHLPYWQMRSKAPWGELDQTMQAEAKRYGWSMLPTMLLLPAAFAAQTAEARSTQLIALLKTVEATRMYAANNDGKLPPSLDALSVPAPIEPVTGKPIDYQLLGDRAVLNGRQIGFMRYRLILRIAD